MPSVSNESGPRRVPTSAQSVARWLLVLGLALVPWAAAGQAPEAPSSEGGTVDPDAVAIARRAGDFLREAARFGFAAESSYEVVQRDGSKLEFGSARRYLVQRPDRLRIETTPRDSSPQLIVFDGRSFVQADLGEKAYARADLKEPRDTDFVIDLLRERLDAPLPLAELLRNDPRPAIEDSLESAAIVGRELLRGMDCDHLALRNPDADVELWIERGKQPFVRRVVITYRTLEGQPSFRADLDAWSLAPVLGEDTFRYVPPPGAERIRFEVRAAPRPREGVAP